MEARLRILGDVDRSAELASLRRWLSADPALRGGVSLGYVRPGIGEMGPLADVLMVALGSGGAATVLLSSIRTWLEQRQSRLSVEIELPDGGVKRVSASGPAARLLAEKLGPGADQAIGRPGSEGQGD
jgi:hypothetical protein